MNRRLKKDRGRAAPTNSFAVTFQSAHNSEVWFEDDVGVSARPMGRSTKRGGASVPHGYRGKLYSLVERAARGAARDGFSTRAEEGPSLDASRGGLRRDARREYVAGRTTRGPCAS